MNPFEAFLPPPHAVLYLANLALAALLASAAALLAAFLFQRRSAPIRYGLLLVGLVLVLTSPGWVWLAGRAGIGRLQVTLSEARDSGDELYVVPDTLRPRSDAPQQPQVPETAGVREPLATVPDAVPESPVVSSCKSERPAEEVVSPSRPPPAVSLPWWWSIAQGVALVWAVGTVVSLAWLLCGLVRLAAYCRGLRPVGWDSVPTGSGQDPSVPSTLSGQSPNLHRLRHAAAQAAAQVGLARAPRLFISGQTVTPVTFGLLRTAVVLPEGFVDGLPPEQLFAVLLHEMAHVARRDPWVGLAQRLAAALYWWCPLVHRLNRRLADVREELCDNYVLSSQGDGASFAEVLVMLAERVAKPSRLPATVSMFEHRRARERSRDLEQRIRRLLSTETSPMTHMNRLGVALVVLLGLGMTVAISLSHVRAAVEDAPTAESGPADSPAPPATVPGAQNGHEVAVAADPLAAPQPSPADPFGRLGVDHDSERHTSEQGKLMADIEKLGGFVVRDEKSRGQPVIQVTLGGSKYVDAFLERLKVFESVQRLALVNTRVTEAGLVHLNGLRKLRTLIVAGPSVSHAFLDGLRGLPQLQDLSLHVSDFGDLGLEHLRGLTQLASLDLKGTQVTDAGLVHLQGTPQLRKLNLSDTKVTEVGLKHVSVLTRLEKLDLLGIRLSDAGLAHLRGLSQLQGLDLRGANVTNDSLVHLRGLTQLASLDLTGTHVTDHGLEHLGGLTRLRALTLDKTTVTGTGLVHLIALTQLRSLNLDGSKADAVAVRRFKKALPRVRIEPGILAWGWDRPAGDADARLTPTTQRILSALWGDTRLDFIKTPLRDVVKFVKDQHEIPIALDEPRLREARIEADVPITRTIKGFSLHSALRQILGKIGLTYAIREEALVLTTAEEGQRLAAQGMIGADEVSREFQKNGSLVWLLQDEIRLQFAATPLEDVLDFLRRQHGILIGVDWRALAAAGIQPDVRCTLHVKDMPLASALRKLLGEVGLTYLVEDESILVTAPTNDPSAKEGSDTYSAASATHQPTTIQNAPAADLRARLSSSPAVKRIVAALLEDTEFKFIETPFPGMVAKIRERHGIPIRVDERTFDDERIDWTNWPVTQMLKGSISLHSSLQLVLSDMDSTYVIRDDTLVITSQVEAQRLARQGVIHADDVKRELEQSPAFRRKKAKIVDHLEDLTQIEFKATPLYKLVDSIQERHGVVIVRDDRAICDVWDDEPRCTLSVKGVKLATALHKLVGDLGLRYVVEGEYILITVAKEHAPPAPSADTTAPSKLGGSDTLETKAIAEIERLGGRVPKNRWQPVVPVVQVLLRGTKVTDTWLEHLKPLTQLQFLHLPGTQITGDGLQHLKGLTQLRALMLSDTQVSDAGLEHLKPLIQLQSLDLRGTKVTDAGLKHLKGLTQLELLDLSYTEVTDAGLQHLRGLRQLEWLFLDDTKVTDAGLKHIKGMHRLQRLGLGGTRITNAGLADLKGLTQLVALYLNGTQVTDVGVEHLKGLTQLQTLDLSSTSVTDAGVNELKKVLPNVRITH